MNLEPGNCYIKFVQHNVNRQNIAHHTILQQALTSYVDIVLLQEPYCMEKGSEGFITISHPSFHTILPCPATPTIITRPRVLAYVRKSCTVEFTPRYDICNDSDMQVIEFFRKEPFYVVNVYNKKECLALHLISLKSVPLSNAIVPLNSVPLSNIVISLNTVTSSNVYTSKYKVREAKQAHWSNFLELAEGAEVFTAFRYTKPALNLKIPTIQYESEGRKVQASTFEEKCTAFLTTLFPIPTNTTPTTNTSQPQKSTCSASKATSKSSGTSQWDWPDLDDTEVKKAIFSSLTKKAPGPDQVGFLLIQKAYQTIPDIFNKVYKTLFRDGVHPNCWKESIGIILSKPNKPDYTIPKAYRVILLLNCLGKVLEKLFASRLAYLANTGNLLNSMQLGGRK